LTNKPASKPRLTDAERHKRFLDMAREVGAYDDKDAFDRAFKKVVRPHAAKQEKAGPKLDRG
jgi:hypothetical protein